MGVSKVVLGEETLVDLTSDSVNEENLLKGATAHNASGEKIEGNILVPTKISQLENDSEFLNNSSTVNFEQASERINIQSSDSIKIILGKIKKWFNDLKPHAFLNPVNNLLATVSGSSLDAMQGKVLDDKISALNNSLGGVSLHENPIIEGEVQEGLYYMGADSVLKKLGKNTITFTCKGVQYYSSLQIALPANNVKRISIVENNTATYPIRVIAYTSKIGYGDSVELLKTTVGGTGELIIDDPSLYKSFRINVAVDKNDYPIDYVAEVEFV